MSEKISKENKDILICIIALVVLFTYYELDSMVLHLNIILFLVIEASLAIFVIIAMMKISWDARKPKQDDMNKFLQKYKPWEILKCPQCKLTVEDCNCHPVPCLFCSEVFGFTQDWNIHLTEVHEKEFREAVLKAVNES